MKKFFVITMVLGLISCMMLTGCKAKTAQKANLVVEEVSTV